jgi:hypothetical protein
MDRRNFVKRSLLAMGASPLLEACTRKKGAEEAGGGSFDSYMGPQRVPQGKLKVQYIRPEIPPFEVPAIPGGRYEDTVPDTLDIAERAKLGINVLTSITDANADQEIYWAANFFRNPPVMWHDCNDWVLLDEGMMESLPLLRAATGSTQNAHVDPVWMQALLKKIGPDGLVYLPLKGDPYVLVGLEGLLPYLEPVWRADRTATKIKDSAVSQLAIPTMFARAIGTMTVYYLSDKNPMWRSAIEKMIQRSKALTVDSGDYAYFPGGAWEPNGKCGTRAEMPIGFMALDGGNGRFIEGLAQYYRATGYEPALQLAGKLANYFCSQARYYERDGAWLIGPDERQWWTKKWKLEHELRGGHGHAHALGLLNILEYATAAGDKEKIKFVRTGYEWAKAHSSPLVGFFPEAFVPDYDRCESCTIADMIALALKLSASGAGDYWDDADRWTRNHFTESQLTSVDWVYRLAERSPRKPVAWNETGDRVAERSIGAFAGWSTGNDFNVESPDHPSSIQHCCTGNSPRTLYYIWEHIVNYDKGKLRVNLLLNRASAWADIHSHIPYQGKAEVKVKKPLESVLVRVPEWVEGNSRQVVAQSSGRQRELRWEGRYVNLGSGKPGDVLAVNFPIPKRRTKETIGAVPYTLNIKGNTVVDIDPPGKNGPMYQRSYYLAQQAPSRKLERFVPDDPIVW